MSSKIGIIDYGMGNLFSVRNGFAVQGVGAEIVEDAGSLARYGKLVLPGVGAFGDAMRELRRRGFISAIKAHVSSGRPFLGICLGMQLLFDQSQESGAVRGLSLVSGEVRKFSSRLKCPHMGWNKIEKRSGEGIFKGIRGDIYAYFCHSFFCRPRASSVVIGRTGYGVKFASVVRQDNIYGMQFHPEKSQEAGLELLKNFAAL